MVNGVPVTHHRFLDANICIAFDIWVVIDFNTGGKGDKETKCVNGVNGANGANGANCANGANGASGDCVERIVPSVTIRRHIVDSWRLMHGQSPASPEGGRYLSRVGGGVVALGQTGERHPWISFFSLHE